MVYKPVHEDFLTKIVEVGWPDDEDKITTIFVRQSFKRTGVDDYREGIVQKIATSTISSGYLSNIVFGQQSTPNPDFPVTISSEDMNFAAWTVYGGAIQYLPFMQEGGMSVPFTLLDFKLNGDPDYYGAIIGTPFGVYGALFTGFVVEPIGTGVMTVNAPGEVIFDDERWVLQPQLTVFEAVSHSLTAAVSYKVIRDDDAP